MTDLPAKMTAMAISAGVLLPRFKPIGIWIRAISSSLRPPLRDSRSARARDVCSDPITPGRTVDLGPFVLAPPSERVLAPPRSNDQDFQPHAIAPFWRLVAEVPLSGEHQGHAVLVRGGHDLLVSLGSPG